MMWWYILGLLPVAVLVWLAYEWYEHTAVQYKSTAVECQKLPKDQELRLCLISDLHNNKKDIPSLMVHIQDFAPDIVLLAGDMVNKHKEENTQARNFLSALSNLNVPVFYSAGNHELTLMEEYPEAWQKYLERLPSNITYLENEAVTFSESICVSGLSLPKTFYQKGKLYDKKEDLPNFFIPELGFHIMLAHNPEYSGLYEKYHADFIVSGHLHGGLLRLPFIGGVVSPRLRLPKGCDAGLMRLANGSSMFVSRGLGSHTIPLRFFNRVEVNFLILKGTKE